MGFVSHLPGPVYMTALHEQRFEKLAEWWICAVSVEMIHHGRHGNFSLHATGSGGVICMGVH